jgi:DNA-repair protein complementing XP-A cells
LHFAFQFALSRVMPLTDQQRQRIEENRKKALEKRTKAQTSPPSNAPAINQHQEPQKEQNWREWKPKSKDLGSGNSLKTDPQGGFVVEEASSAPVAKRQKTAQSVVYMHDILPRFDPDDLSTMVLCDDCSLPDIDPDLYLHYKLTVCTACRDSKPEKYTLLTKTEAQNDYLLTDEELRDSTKMPHWERPNPRKSTYARMKLYVRCQVEAFAFEVIIQFFVYSSTRNGEVKMDWITSLSDGKTKKKSSKRRHSNRNSPVRADSLVFLLMQ